MERDISSPVRCLYLLILADDNVDIFATSWLMSCCSFSFVTLSSIAILSFYILSKRLRLKDKDYLIQEYKKEYDFAVHFLIKIHKIFKVNI